jgi:hypothetical protein
MEAIYSLIRSKAREIVSSYPPAAFYRELPDENEFSKKIFYQDPVIGQLRSYLADNLAKNYGHGLKHAIKVSIDAGALLVIESRQAGCPENLIQKRVIIVQCAGLLHDSKRSRKDHAVRGAAFAKKHLRAYPFTAQELEDICRAILNHEAFKDTVETTSDFGALVSDCLYDADKFRMGPDNFYDTVWEMVSFSQMPLPKFMGVYPAAMKWLEKIKTTFRTRTGQKYGPQFIDTGLAIGHELFEFIRTEIMPSSQIEERTE